MRISIETSRTAQLQEEMDERDRRYQAELAVRMVVRQQKKLEILEMMIANNISTLTAHADGSGDSGSLDNISCFVDGDDVLVDGVTGEETRNRITVDTPEGMEALIEYILDTSGVNFNNDGGYWDLDITVATRELSETVGWYYTESESNTETETL